MIDVADPDEDFDAARFAAMAAGIIADMDERGVLPVLAGGTGLYIKALTRGLFDTVPGDRKIRDRLKAAAEDKGVAVLYKELEKVDPETADRIHPNDSYRVLRALEVYEATGRPMSQHQAAHGFADEKYHTLKIGLTLDRKKLYDRINRRVDLMIDAGLEEEVRELLDRGYSPELKSMQSIGYRHMAAYLKGRIPWDEMLETLKRDTRRYAKRQFTWFRADPEMQWFETQETEKILGLVRRFLEKS
jgi:tRNA dimethylallyltransferase